MGEAPSTRIVVKAPLQPQGCGGVTEAPSLSHAIADDVGENGLTMTSKKRFGMVLHAEEVSFAILEGQGNVADAIASSGPNARRQK